MKSINIKNKSIHVTIYITTYRSNSSHNISDNLLLDKNEGCRRNGTYNVRCSDANVLLKWHLELLSVSTQLPFITRVCKSFDCLYTERLSFVNNDRSKFVICSDILENASTKRKCVVISCYGSFLG